MKKISNECLEAIKGFEGFRSDAYKCPAGVWTIGYGHTDGVRCGQKVTQEEAEIYLKKDILPCEHFVNGLGINLNQGQFDSLVDFCYNAGPGNLNKSTLLKKVRADVNDPSIATEFKRWTYGGGKILPGLVKRREWEAKRYFCKI